MAWNGRKRPKKLPVEVTEDEFAALLDATRQIKHRLAFLLAWGSGLRVSEVINLKPEDFDFKQKQVRINQGKGKKDRIVPIPKGFREDHLKHLPFDFNTRALQKAFKLYAGKSGLLKQKPTVHFHSLRHGFATHCLRKGVNLKSIQLMLGHSDIATTSVYLQLAPEEALNEYQDKF